MLPGGPLTGDLCRFNWNLLRPGNIACLRASGSSPRAGTLLGGAWFGKPGFGKTSGVIDTEASLEGDGEPHLQSVS